MTRTQLTVFAAGMVALALSAGGAFAQTSPAAPSQQEIEVKLRGLPTLGPAPARPHNMAVVPASVPPSELEQPQAAHRRSYWRAPQRSASATVHHRFYRGVYQRSASATPADRTAATQGVRPSMDFHTITFRFGSAELTPQSVETLRNLGNALNQGLKDVKKFIVQGHTDRVGSAAYNLQLSKRRAEAVRDYLVNKMGVAPDRLEAVGLGFSEPVDPARPYAAENRRVVVINASAS
jgi:outer membrane protein OmpA-like peptidoglycan-associated protein